MATRRRPSGFRGGISRWVPAAEALRIRADVEACETVGGLLEWTETADFGPAGQPTTVTMLWYRIRLFPEVADEPVDARGVLSLVLPDLACRRRRLAIEEYATRAGLTRRAARDSDLARCPACDAPANDGGFYCNAHQVEQEAEVQELLTKRETT